MQHPILTILRLIGEEPPSTSESNFGTTISSEEPPLIYIKALTNLVREESKQYVPISTVRSIIQAAHGSTLESLKTLGQQTLLNFENFNSLLNLVIPSLNLGDVSVSVNGSEVHVTSGDFSGYLTVRDGSPTALVGSAPAFLGNLSHVAKLFGDFQTLQTALHTLENTFGDFYVS